MIGYDNHDSIKVMCKMCGNNKAVTHRKYMYETSGEVFVDAVCAACAKIHDDAIGGNI